MTNQSPAEKAKQQLAIFAPESRGIAKMADVVWEMAEEFMTEELAEPEGEWDLDQVQEYIDRCYEGIIALIFQSIRGSIES